MYILGVAFFAALVFALVITPLVRNAFLHFGLVDIPDNNRKLHQKNTPRVGGISLLLSYILSGIVLFLVLPSGHSLEKEYFNHWQIGLAVLIVFATGLADDIFKLRPRHKLLGEVLAALIAYAGGIEIPLLQNTILGDWLTPPLTIFWLLLCTNAFNLIDGMDGLASGIGLLAAVTMSAAAFAEGNFFLALVTLTLCGCLVGFLRYNFNPASVFLGDCGSLSIGFLLGCCGALWGKNSPGLLGMSAPIVALSLPLLDTLLSIIRRFIRHRPIFTADRGHIHHRLLDRGVPARQAALLLYGLALIAMFFSLLLHFSVDNVFNIVVILCLFFGTMVLCLRYLGYSEFKVAKDILWHGRIQQMIDDEVNLSHLELTLRSAKSVTHSWQLFKQYCKALGFSEVRVLNSSDNFDTIPGDHHLWSFRIPLNDGNAILLRRSAEFNNRTPPLSTLARIATATFRSTVALQSTAAQSTDAFNAAIPNINESSASVTPVLSS